MESLTLIFMFIRETAADRGSINTFDLNSKRAKLNMMIMVVLKNKCIYSNIGVCRDKKK